ncbi:transcription factor HHO5-like isoform X2 [Salvia hispanica]|uniref:transcription factor HHO5-like isoform X2 n=1 Tax=Salvia hispanica TaxID=49212 RepID=UPI002009AEE3|nr:transcription factor HHO5-like isoform X2 [Salvia hispanica]
MNFDLGSKNISEILSEVSGMDDFIKKSSMLDFHVHALEEELHKIEAFKRELPHCMHLLKHVIERLKAESGRDGRVKASNEFTEKKDWRTSVQICTPMSRDQAPVFPLKSRFAEGLGNGNQFGGKLRNEGGAFSPFKRAMNEKSEADLSDDGTHHKKQRRCWSPELHKIFVDALHQLGGAQTATPKQIRERMKVEGLTNDEVKSHLQKYRIYMKRVDSAEPIAVSGFPVDGGKKVVKGGSAATSGQSIGNEDEDEDKDDD